MDDEDRNFTSDTLDDLEDAQGNDWDDSDPWAGEADWGGADV